MDKIRCAVIGGNGYIGRHLVFFLKKKGIIPMVYDVADSDQPFYKKIDITAPLSVAEIDFNVDYIFMFAGITGTFVGFDQYQAFNSINEIGLLNLLDAIRKSKYRPKIVFPSTRLVYRGIDKALSEDDEKETKTIYASNKLACESFLRAYHNSFGIPYAIFRICIPYGNLLSADYSFGTVGFFIKQAKEGKDITLYGGGDIKRTFTHIEDLCYQIVNGSFHPDSSGETFNVGGETHTLRKVAEIIARKYGVHVVDVPWPDKDLRIESGHTYFDDTKIQSLLHLGAYKMLTAFTNDL